MKTLFISFLLLAQALIISAQTMQHCSSHELLKRQMELDPTLKVRMMYSEQKINEYIKIPTGQSALRIADTNKVNSSIIIPVVVHVVYNTEEQNISAQQIQSQIQILNQDYQRLNTDTTLTPAPFKPVAGKMNITFQLANLDPNGQYTDGITRKQTNVMSFSDGDNGVKKPSLGGDTAWPEDKYLNLWVANLAGNLLGYAQYPDDNRPTTDGVVIHYKACGNIGTATDPYKLGRTATHEIGHWLNLYHTWGDANCGDDYVDDTPPQAAPSTNQCPIFPRPSTCNSNSISNVPNGDMFMDYMDYTNDACMNMFTKGQVARMFAAIAVFPARSALKTSNGCNGIAANPTNKDGIGISPNPNNGEFKLSYHFADTQNIKITIYSVLGQMVYAETYYNKQFGEETIKIPYLPKGLYIVSCKTQSQQYTQKIVIE